MPLCVFATREKEFLIDWANFRRSAEIIRDLGLLGVGYTRTLHRRQQSKGYRYAASERSGSRPLEGEVNAEQLRVSWGRLWYIFFREVYRGYSRRCYATLL